MGVASIRTPKNARTREAVAVLVAQDLGQSNFGFTAFSEVRLRIVLEGIGAGRIRNIVFPALPH